MNNTNGHISYSAEDIARYHAGKMTDAEMHALEKAALNDAFLADALEGYAFDPSPIPSLSEIDKRISKKINEKEESKIVPLFNYKRWLAAASIVGIIGIAAYLYNSNIPGKPDTVTVAEQTKTEEKVETTTPENPVIVSRENPQYKAEPTAPVSVIVPDNPEKTAIPKNIDPVKAPAIVAAKDNPSVTQAINEPQNITESVAKSTESTKEAMPTDDAVAHAPSTKAMMSEVEAVTLDKKRVNKQNYFGGTVVDEYGQPVRGAAIKVAGTQKETYTDLSGNFRILEPASSIKVEMTMTGFSNDIETLNPYQYRNIILKRQRQNIDNEAIAGIQNNNGIRTSGNMTEVVDPKRIKITIWGGTPQFQAYIRENTPKPFYENGEKIQGSLQLKFNIDKNGRPKKIWITDSLTTKTEEHFINLIKNGPIWQPAGGRGKVTFEIE